MDRLWAPWRKAYIRPDKKKSRACVFCSLLRNRARSRDYLLAQTRLCFAVLNLYPYNNGHVLVLPRRHVASPWDLTDAEKLDWLDLAARVQGAIEKKIHPHGFNLGINLGSAAGAGIPGHLHLHIVPRWIGDSNFMPIVGGVKVISESLRSVYRELKPELEKAGRKSKR